MTTSTKAGKSVRHSARSAFTLVEIMIAMLLSSILVFAIIHSFGYVVRTNYSLSNYIKMDQEARRALEQLGRDVKQCNRSDATYPLNFTYSNLGASSETQVIQLGIPSAANATVSAKVLYTFTKSGDQGTLVRSLTDNGTTKTTKLATNITSFKVSGAALDNTYWSGIDNVSANKAVIKQIQLEMTLASDSIRRKVTGASTQTIISAQYSIRK